MNATPILVVEDERLIARDLQRRLERLGYRVLGPAASGEEALALAEQTAPALALMDIILQGELDGIQTAELLCRRFDIPIVYLTAYTDPTILARARVTSPSGYLVKPFNERDLSITLELALYRSQAERDLHLRERALAAAANGILITDARQPDNPVIYCNPAFEQLTGYRAEEVLGRNCRFLQGPDSDPAARAEIRQALREGRACQVTTKNYRKDGTPFWNALHIAPVHDGAGRLTHFVGVQNDITRLVEVNTQLQAALKAKDEMIQNVSHELRTPLTMIKGYIELLKDALLGPLTAEQEQAAQVMDQQSKRLLFMIDRLLTFQMFDVRAVRKAPLDLAPWLAQAVGQWTMQAGKIGVEFRLEVAASLPPVLADPDFLGHVVSNLLDNAVKFSPDGGQVTVRAYCAGDRGGQAPDRTDTDNGVLPPAVVIAVADQGIGIPRDRLDRLFERFYQVDGSTSRRFGGMGIGLALCQTIVEAHGGRIWGESAGEDQGSTFYVALPLTEG